jgi:hypothetical protein
MLPQFLPSGQNASERCNNILAQVGMENLMREKDSEMKVGVKTRRWVNKKHTDCPIAAKDVMHSSSDVEINLFFSFCFLSVSMGGRTKDLSATWRMNPNVILHQKRAKGHREGEKRKSKTKKKTGTSGESK